nr:response regulator [Candidatus Desulfolinea nitratireducens]
MAKIVIAEDERDIRDLIAFTLRFAGHEVVTAANGEEAVEMAIQENPDLIMLDVRMPRMTGYDACRAIKANPAFVNTPVVFLSAKGQESEIESGLDAGAEEYFLKPFAPAELTKRVLEILAKYANETGTDKYTNETGADKYANETGTDKYTNETGNDKYANETG